MQEQKRTGHPKGRRTKATDGNKPATGYIKNHALEGMQANQRRPAGFIRVNRGNVKPGDMVWIPKLREYREVKHSSPLVGKGVHEVSILLKRSYTNDTALQ